MRQWTYSWTSSDGLRHEGELYAPSKDDAYAELRKQGIRAIRVTERIVPVVRKGLKGLRKRDIAAIAVCAVLLVGVAWLVASRRSGRPVQKVTVSAVENMVKDPAMRKELLEVVKEREALEKECRERFVRRVREGTLSKDEANELFRAMGLEEIK